jgi:CRISPR-associated protein Cas1
MVVYVRTQGVKIVKEGQHLLVKKGDAVYHTLFTHKLRQLVIFGNVEITHSAFSQLMRNNIDTVFMRFDGRYLGRISPPEAKNVFLHKRQYTLLDDRDFAMRLARCIVAGNLTNMATCLMRIKRSREDAVPGQKAQEIQRLMKMLESAPNIESVRGYEGRCAALYFEAFPRGFVADMGFKRRVRRPPTDPVNAVLSLLYTFLMNRVYAAVRIAGLDPYPGFLHAIDYGRYSLVLDLMEEFRTIISDTLTLSLFNLKILKKEDFYTEKPDENPMAETPKQEIPDVTKGPIGLINLDGAGDEVFDLPEQRMDEDIPFSAEPTGKYPVKLHHEAFKRVIDAFEKKLTTSFYYPTAGRQMTYDKVIVYQAEHFRKVIEGKAEIYQPVVLK